MCRWRGVSYWRGVIRLVVGRVRVDQRGRRANRRAVDFRGTDLPFRMSCQAADPLAAHRLVVCGPSGIAAHYLYV
jgi:hypothetical protein